jgi:superfamily II DNA or RNA helicase
VALKAPPLLFMEKQVTLKYDGAFCYVSSKSRAVLNLIDDVLSYTDKNATYLNRFNKFNKKESRSCFDKRKKRFPTGLLPRVCKQLDSADYKYKLEGNITIPLPKVTDNPFPEWAFDHQIELVEDACDNARGIGKSPTGSGKTMSICFFSSLFPDQNILIIAPRNGILRKTRSDLSSYLKEDVGAYGDGKKQIRRVTVATINSLYRNLESIKEWLESINILVIDECHNVSDGMYLTVTSCCSNRSYSWGVSATPYRNRGDDLWMEGILGPIITSIPEEGVVKEGIIQRPNYYIIHYKHPHYEGVKDKNVEQVNGRRVVRYNTFNEKPHRDEIYWQGIAVNKERNALFVELLDYYLKHPKRTGVGLILFHRVEQGNDLFNQAKEKGLPVYYADHLTKETERLKIVEGMRTGEIEALIASGILNEGEDIPNLEFCGIASGGSNPRTPMQQSGRVVRNKANAMVFDIYDEEDWYLEKNSTNRTAEIEKNYPGSITYAKSVTEAKRYINSQLRNRKSKKAS